MEQEGLAQGAVSGLEDTKLRGPVATGTRRACTSRVPSAHTCANRLSSRPRERERGGHHHHPLLLTTRHLPAPSEGGRPGLHGAPRPDAAPGASCSHTALSSVFSSFTQKSPPVWGVASVQRRKLQPRQRPRKPPGNPARERVPERFSLGRRDAALEGGFPGCAGASGSPRLREQHAKQRCVFAQTWCPWREEGQSVSLPLAVTSCRAA